MSDKKIDFFIAGTQKGGTTALQRKLRGHPDIILSQRKELHFFDDEKLDWKAPDYSELHKHFDFSRDGVFGEATPIYMYWPNAIQRIWDYNPSAKIIIILRHPVFRALSAWKMEKARGDEWLSFGLAVSWLGRQRVKWSPRGVHRVYSYIERSEYAAQLRRLLKIFPRDQILFLTSDELWRDEAATLARTSAFLGVDQAYFSEGTAENKYIVPVDSRHIEMKKGKIIDRLNEQFRQEILDTAEISGLDLTHWTEKGYRESMRGD